MKFYYCNMRKRLREAIIPALITLTVYFTVIALKGIFPFGAGRIDYYDMGQTNAPLYYHIWDFLHGRSGLFYTWYINQGQNLSMGSSIQWNISIFNLFFLLVPRRLVMESLSLFLALHLFFMSFNMNLLLQRIVPGKAHICRIMTSVAYGLCGYTLTHYTIPTYLDTAALMPLYLLTLIGVLKTEADGGDSDSRSSVFIYAVATGYMTALSYYLAYMNLFFILLLSGTYVLLLCPKDKDFRGRIALRLGTGTFSGLGLSAFMLLPAAMQMSQSSRFQSNLEKTPLDTVKEILWAIGADMYYIKWWALAGSLAACIAILIGLIRYRKEKNIALFWFLICFYPCALIPFESINLIIHMGTYYHYPMRCGYWIPLTLLTAGTYYMSRLTAESGDRIIFVAVATFAAGVGILIYYSSHPLWEVQELFNAWLIFAGVLAVIYAYILLTGKDIRYLACILALELFCGAYVGYGLPHFTDTHAAGPEQDGDYVMTAMRLQDELDIEESRTDRIKNPDTGLNTNYGMVMRRATIGGWANTMPRSQMDHAGSLGYTLHFMRVMDSGGTLFSDALLHITQTLTHEPFYCDNEAYNTRSDDDGHDRSGGYELYENVYTLPFAMPVSTELTYDEADYDVVRSQNKYYHALSGTEEDIIESVGDPSAASISIAGRKALYLGGGQADEITVDGKVIPVPSLGQPYNRAYPTEFNGALIFAGIYKDRTIEICGLKGGKAYLLDIDALEKLCRDFETLSQKVTANKTGLQVETDDIGGREMVLIPMSYDPGLTATVNGVKQKIINVDDILIGIPVEHGNNVISIRFRPLGTLPGIIISILTFILLAMVNMQPDIKVPSALYSCSIVALRILWLTVITVLYIIPLAAFVVHQIQKRV